MFGNVGSRWGRVRVGLQVECIYGEASISITAICKALLSSDGFIGVVEWGGPEPVPISKKSLYAEYLYTVDSELQVGKAHEPSCASSVVDGDD